MDEEPYPPAKEALSKAEHLQYSLQWYSDFMKEAFESEPQGCAFEDIKHGVTNSWNEFSAPKQHALGDALAQYRAALKAKDDAAAHLEYAKAYRGAPDDPGASWRPGIEYYERRRVGVVTAEANLATVCEALAGRFDEISDTLERPYAMELAQRFAESAREMRRVMGVEMPRLKGAAEGKIRALEVGQGKRVAQKAGGAQKKLGVVEAKPGVAQTKPGEAQSGTGWGWGGSVAGSSDGQAEKPGKKKNKKRGKGKGGKKGGGDGGGGWGGGGDGSPQLGSLSLDDSELEWKGRMPLDDAGSDAVNLWLGVRNDRIRKRTVHKKVDLDLIWDMDHYWTNGAPGERISWTEDSIPTELHAHKELTHPSGKDSIVQLLSYANEGEQSAHLYLEWCPFGDASSLVKGKSVYCSDRHGDRHLLPHEDFTSSSQLIPEPFCWAALLSMVKAGLMMERGQVDASGANRDWTTIVHRDLKVSNIFLGLSGQEFVGYPSTKAGDFGIVILVPSNDTRSPLDLCTEGTKDHAAPEMLLSLRHPDGSYVRQSTKTNVWGVGMILYSLLAGRFGPAGEVTGYLNFDREDRREPPEFDTTTKMGYSQKLRDLVMACLRYEAKDRPTFDYLLEEILASTNGDQADLAHRMRTLRRGAPEYQRHRLKYRAVDKYAIGFAYGRSGFEDHADYIAAYEKPYGLTDVP